MRYFLFVIFIFYSTFALSQTGDPVLLKKQLHEVSDPKKRVLLLCDLGKYYTNSSPQLSLAYGQKAMALADSIGFDLGLALAYNTIGISYDKSGSYDKAAQYYYRSLRIREAIQDSVGLASSYNNIGSIYNIKGSLDKAIKFYLKSLRIATALHDTAVISKSYNNLGGVYQKQKDLETSLSYLKKALALKEKMGDTVGVVIGMNNVGYLNNDLQRYDEAIAYHQKAMALVADQGNTLPKAYSLYGLAQAYYYKGVPKQALPYALENLELVKDLRANDEVAIVTDLLHLIYSDLADYQNAYLYLNMHAQYQDSIHTLEIDARITELQLEYDKEKTENDNQLLKAETEAQRQRIERNNAIQYFTLAILVVVCILALMFFRGRRRQHTINDLLLQKNNDMYEYTSQLEKREKMLTLQAEQLKAQKEELNKLNSVRDRLISIVAHDLKGPLLSLKGLLQVVAKGNFPQAKLTHFMGLLELSQQNSLWLLDNLLLWAKAQMSGLRVKPVTLALKSLMDDNVKLLQPQAEQKDIAIASHITPEHTIFADKEMISLVIRNIVSNAIKFCRKGDKIDIRATLTTTNCLTVMVTDTGIGIPEEQLKHLFDINHTHTSTPGTANEKGSGLGLQLCQTFIDLNGGRIWAESEASGGTTFSFSLPVNAPNATALADSCAPARALA